MSWRVVTGNVLEVLPTLPEASVQSCVTSPPYWNLRNYGVAGQLGAEATPHEYVESMVQVFALVWRVLKDDGTLWLNLGDSYAQSGGTGLQGATSQRVGRSNVEAQQKPCNQRPPDGLKAKDLVGIPWRMAFALQDAGWYLRSDIIWAKPNPMPESVTDRPTKAHEYIFLLTKSARYYYDADAIKEPYSENSFPRLLRAQDSANRLIDGIVPGKPAQGLYAPRDKQSGHGRRHAGFNARWDERERQLEDAYTGQATKDYQDGGAQNPSDTKRRVLESMRDGLGANCRSVWTVATQPFAGAHFATFPEAIPERCIKAGSRPGDVILDPFSGAGTTGLVADRLGRDYVGVELNPVYAEMSRERIRQVTPLLSTEAV